MIMKLSTKGRYGLRAMIDLALYSEKEPASIASIAARQHISESYLEQLIAKLRKAGLVTSVRGACGGYVSLKDKPLAGTMVDRVMESAADHGAEELITACPLCLYNLRTSGSAKKLPVTYLTELLAEALGLIPEKNAEGGAEDAEG